MSIFKGFSAAIFFMIFQSASAFEFVNWDQGFVCAAGTQPAVYNHIESTAEELVESRVLDTALAGQNKLIADRNRLIDREPEDLVRLSRRLKNGAVILSLLPARFVCENRAFARLLGPNAKVINCLSAGEMYVVDHSVEVGYRLVFSVQWGFDQRTAALNNHQGLLTEKQKRYPYEYARQGIAQSLARKLSERCPGSRQ